MLTRLVRIQLAVFTIASVIGITAMVLTYVQIPTLFGLGRITVTLKLPATGGLYQFADVTYRGVAIGKVTAVELTLEGADATMSLASEPKVPADLVADVRSMSAVGEQYVDLLPRSTSRGYLHDGSIIAMADTSIPQPVGPMLDRVSALVGSIPKDRLGQLLDESFTALNGAGDDLETIVDATSTLSRDLDGVSGQSRALIDDSAPLLDAQAQAADSTRTWARSLARITGTIAGDDPQVRNILRTGPGLAQDVSQLLNQVKPTLPVLLANLASLGQVGVTYRPGLEQLLVLLPPSAAYYQAERPINNPAGQVVGDFRVAVDDPPACTVGFLPPSQWRSPADTSEVDTPDGLYCKLPQDSPIAVRGARNLPCMDHPGKRAPTVDICDSDQPYEPLAIRQHALGPPPFDPNLVAQGIPLDGRVPGQQQIFAPVEGTPMPPATSTPTQPPLPQAPVAAAAPSAYHDPSASGPSVATAEYDPRTGRFLAPDGTMLRQTDIVSGPPGSWKDLVLP
jgi:phospholipid/cholesterol/gamma-HCH transport system substrate-binding protein